MPKITRSSEEIQAIKDRILKEAVNLITAAGFNNLSIRQLATRVGMTAANIYNYYANKDELYLDIQTKGFQKLRAMLDDAYQTAAGAPLDRIKAVMHAYMNFGTNYPGLYDVMFSLNTPKYSDYVNTPLEPAARLEKTAGLAVANAVIDNLLALHGSDTPLSRHIAAFRMIQAWTALHGLVNIYNSRVLQEVDDDASGVIARCIDLYARLVTAPAEDSNTPHSPQ